jgi:hypothetical protein
LGPSVAADTPKEQKAEEKRPTWEKVWDDPITDAVIRRLIGAVKTERMSKHLFALSKDPLPFRKLNFTLPGHKKIPFTRPMTTWPRN